MHAEVRALEPRAARAGVVVRVQIVPAESRVLARVAPRAAGVLIRELVAHAIVATPRGSAVSLTATAAGEDGLGARVVVDDAGTALPAGARRALLSLEVEPGTFGRPSSVALFVAAEIAAAQGARLEMGDAPLPNQRGESREEGRRGGGVRVTVTFPR